MAFSLGSQIFTSGNTAAFSNTVTATTLVSNGNVVATGNISGSFLSGNGTFISNLANVPDTLTTAIGYNTYPATPTPGAFTGTVRTVTTYAELTAAITAAVDGDIIAVTDTIIATATVVFNKRLKVTGPGIIRTAGAGSDPTTVVSVTADGVWFDSTLTITHSKTTNTSVESAVTVNALNFVSSAVVNFIEFGYILRGSFTIDGAITQYVGALGNAHRHIAIYRVSAPSAISNVVYDFPAEATPRASFIFVGSSSGTDTFTSSLTVRNTRQQTASRVQRQFYFQEALVGGGGSLIFDNNQFNDLNGGIGFLSSTVATLDFFTSIVAVRNTQGSAGAASYKGLIYIDGSGTGRSYGTTAQVLVGTNTLPTAPLRADYASVLGTASIAVKIPTYVATPYTNVITNNNAFNTAIAALSTASYSNAVSSAYLASGTNSANIVTTGNVSGGNLLTSGRVVATDNVVTSAQVVATGNVSGGNVVTVGQVVATANITTSAQVVASGNVTGNFFIGDGSLLTNLTGANVTGTVANATYSLNANSSSFAGVAFSVDGANVSGEVLVANTVSNPTQSNITALGTITALTATSISANTLQTSGNAQIGGNLNVSGNINAIGNINIISGNSGQFFGNASTGFGALYAGLPAGYTLLAQEVMQFATSFDGYTQVSMQNINSGSQATSDFIATADNGTDENHYIDLGIASSGYNGVVAVGNNALGTSVYPTDGYLYTRGNVTGGNLVLGSNQVDGVVRIIANGASNIGDVVATFSAGGLTVANTVLAAQVGNSATYLYGNGSNISGLPAPYTDANVSTYLASGNNTGGFVSLGNISLGGVSNTTFLGSRSSTPTTVTLSFNSTVTPAPFATGDKIVVEGGSGVDGTWTVVSGTTDDVTFNNNSNPGPDVYTDLPAPTVSLLNISSVTASGTITGGAFTTSGTVTATEVNAGDFNTTGNVVAGLVNTLALSVTGTTNLNNIGNITIAGGNAGEILTTNGSGNLSWTRGVSVGTMISGANVTPSVNNTQYNVTALAEAATILAPTGTPVDGQKLTIRIIDDGNAQALTWNAIYQEIGTTLPVTTVASKYVYVGCIYNAQVTTWDVVSVAQQV
jgi:hypothetical protein